ncbi:MAG: CAP domain-containing protein [Actinomycetota bacterium]|nr:CAP domain-containing protein [Actinomycetota bacterium]
MTFAPDAGAVEALDGPVQLPRDEGAPDLLGGGKGGGSKYRYRASEKCFMRKVNRVRAAHDQRRLRWDKQLGYVARRHARVLANHGGVWHDQNLGHRVTRWRTLGQNTGAGGKCRRLFRSFMDSAPHRANILGRWRFIGAGTQRKGNRLYVQTIFEFRRNPGNVWSWP